MFAARHMYIAVCGASSALLLAGCGDDKKDDTTPPALGTRYFVFEGKRTTGGTDETGPVYIYSGPTGYGGAYVRTSGNTSKSGLMQQLREEGNMLTGTWQEVDGSTGAISIDLNKLKNDEFDATLKQGSSPETSWTHTQVYKDGDAVQKSAVPFQTRWVEAMNAQKPDICGSLYTENAIFNVYNGVRAGEHVKKTGRTEITSFWNDVVNNQGVRRMEAGPSAVNVLSDNEIAVSYDSFRFLDAANAEKMKGFINYEQWVRQNGEWLVNRDIVTATP